MNWKTYLKKKGARIGAIVLAVVLVLALIAGALGGKAGFLTNLDGIVRAPLFSMQEPAIDGALSKCIRLMVQVANYGERVEPRHVYLHEAAKLRPDLVKNQ